MRENEVVKEMKCEPDFFFDKTLSGCLPCEDSCNPIRPSTENECQIHCSAYLLRVKTSSTTDGFSPTYTGNSQNSSVIVIISLVVTLVILFTCLVVMVTIFRFRRNIYKTHEKDIRHFTESVEETSSEDLKKQNHPRLYQTSSLCEFHASSGYAPSRPSNKNSCESLSEISNLVSVSQETATTQCEMQTLIKEAATTNLVASDRTIRAQVEEASIDLQEDFDYVEQAYELPDRGSDVMYLSNYSCSPTTMKTHQITAALQRLAWVKQFWWDAEGAKVVVDDSHLRNGKENIRNILRRKGIPPQEFSFEIVSPLVFG